MLVHTTYSQYIRSHVHTCGPHFANMAISYWQTFIRAVCEDTFFRLRLWSLWKVFAPKLESARSGSFSFRNLRVYILMCIIQAYPATFWKWRYMPHVWLKSPRPMYDQKSPHWCILSFSKTLVSAILGLCVSGPKVFNVQNQYRQSPALFFSDSFYLAL